MARSHVHALQHNDALFQKALAAKSLGFGKVSPRSAFTALTQALADQADALRQDDLSKWEGSLFEAVRSSWNQSKGVRIGEPLARTIFESQGLSVGPAFETERGLQHPTASYDLHVTTLDRVEVKLSTEGVDGTFQWGGMRPTDADHMLLLGVRPNELNGWLIPGGQLNRLLSLKRTGKEVRGLFHGKGDFSVKVKAEGFPNWMTRFGGTQEALVERIQRESRRRGPR